VIALLAIVALYFGGVAVLGAIPVNGEFAPAQDGVELCVRSNGAHSDFVLPAQSSVIDWHAQHPPEHFPRIAGTYDHIAFGWGDRAFYLETPTWADLQLSTALVALSGLGRAALHVEYLERQAPGERSACTRLSEAQHRALADYIQASFERDADGRVMRIDAPGYGSADAFYEAHGTFSAFVTCNEWVRRGLSASGVRAPAWSPFDGALLRQLRAADSVE
jgi:uncharacterized protein (TIGR02117 family)